MTDPDRTTEEVTTSTDKPPFPGLVLTDTDPVKLFADDPALSLDAYIGQVPRVPPVTVQATHAQVADAVREVLGSRLIRTTDRTWMSWQGGTWSAATDETAEKIIKRLISSGSGPRKIIPYTTRKTTRADIPGLLASGLVDEDADGNLVWKSNRGYVTHIPIADDKWANSTVNIQGVRRVLAGEVLTDAEFDADPTVLNCAGQVLRLQVDRPDAPVLVDELHPGDYITKSTAVGFDPNATCPVFDAAVEQILPDAEVRRFFQMAVGMSLYGKPRDHVFFVLRGRGRNGKTLLLELFAKVLGDYGMIFPSSLIEEARGEQHPTELMDLKGCRMAVVSETEQGRRWNVNRLKRLSGGDTQKARGMRKDYEKFAPTHTLWIASNNRPLLSAPDPALFERYREIDCPTQWYAPGAPLDEQIGKAGEADLGLADKLEAEAAGVFRWMVQGWVAYVRNGAKLFIPPDVLRVSNEARATATTFSVFAREALQRGTDTDYVETAQVFTAWKAYLAAESMFSAEKPTRSRDVGEFLMREFSYANAMPRTNGRDTAKTYGLCWTESGRSWASLDNTIGAATGTDATVTLIATSRGRR